MGVSASMGINRCWISTDEQLPNNGQYVYFFNEAIGIILGEYYYQEYRYGDSNIFVGNGELIEGHNITYWMPYDHALRSIIPLPPDYHRKIKPLYDNKQTTFNFYSDYI